MSEKSEILQATATEIANGCNEQKVGGPVLGLIALIYYVLGTVVLCHILHKQKQENRELTPEEASEALKVECSTPQGTRRVHRRLTRAIERRSFDSGSPGAVSHAAAEEIASSMIRRACGASNSEFASVAAACAGPDERTVAMASAAADDDLEG